MNPKTAHTPKKDKKENVLRVENELLRNGRGLGKRGRDVKTSVDNKEGDIIKG